MICNTLNHVDSGVDLIARDVRVLKDLIRGLPPLPFDHIPHPLDRVEGAALRGEEHELEHLCLQFRNLRILMYLEVVHDDNRWMLAALLAQVDHEGQERIDRVAASEYRCVDQPILGAEGSYHRDRLPSGVGQLHLHAWFDPYSGRGLPQVETRLVDVDDIDMRLVLEGPRNCQREFLLPMQQLLRPRSFGAVDYLRLAIGHTELTIDGLDQRARELVTLELVAHGLRTLFKGEVPL